MASLYNDLLLLKLEDLQKKIPDSRFKDIAKNDPGHKLSYTFTVFSIMNILDLSLEDALEAMTDGGNDQNIDAVIIDDLSDTEGRIDVSIFQTKLLRRENLKDASIGENDIRALVSTIDRLLDGDNISPLNNRVKQKIEEIRILTLRQKISPNINLYFVCNGEMDITTEMGGYIGEHSFEYYTIQRLMTPSKKDKPFKHSLRTSHKTEIINLPINNIRGIVCSISIKELIELYEKGGGEALLELNIRGYLGHKAINKKIQETIADPDESQYFIFYNNGISIICSDMTAKKDANGHYIIEIQDPKIINGGQTTHSVYDVYRKNPSSISEDSYVMVRLYELSDQDLMGKITEYTNSQNAINFRDLQSNNRNQKLIKELFEAKGYDLNVRREQPIPTDKKIVTNDNLVQIYATLYNNSPHKAKTSKSTIFRKIFSEVFSQKDGGIAQKLYRGYIIWEYISQQQNNASEENYALLAHAKYGILYTMKNIDAQLLDLSKDDASVISLCKHIYPEALKIIKTISDKDQEDLGNAYSHANLFKSARSTELIEKYITNEK